MGTDITIVVDNNAGRGLAAEHGLAVWIESGPASILFDTGQGRALERNARALGIDPSSALNLVLSHGHYDHTGGLGPVLRQAPTMQVYCHPAAVLPRYSVRDGAARTIGMPEQALEALERFPAKRVHWVQRPLALATATGEGPTRTSWAAIPGSIGLTGPVPRHTSFEDTGGPFYLDPEGTRPDLIEDDLALWITTEQGLVICLGCAHAGVVNTLEYVIRLTGISRIQAVIGGFHLLGASPDRLEQTVSALCRLAPDAIYPCHCTGEAAIAALMGALGERVHRVEAGMTFRF